MADRRSNLFWPFSGPVAQEILPWRLWLRSVGQWGWINIINQRTPDPELERRIIGEVASYGRQLGRISEALDAVIAGAEIDRTKLKDDKHIAAIFQFRQMIKDIKHLKGEQLPED